MREDWLLIDFKTVHEQAVFACGCDETLLLIGITLFFSKHSRFRHFITSFLDPPPLVEKQFENCLHRRYPVEEWPMFLEKLAQHSIPLVWLSSFHWAPLLLPNFLNVLLFHGRAPTLLSLGLWRNNSCSSGRFIAPLWSEIWPWGAPRVLVQCFCFFLSFSPFLFSFRFSAVPFFNIFFFFFLT